MSRLIAPMLATAGPPLDGDWPWSFEMKYDGCRLLASVGGGREPELWTRNLNHEWRETPLQRATKRPRRCSDMRPWRSRDRPRKAKSYLVTWITRAYSR